MSFLHPGAFAGLASLLVLILLSLWRQRPARVVVPSVRLWERIADRLPPVKSLSRPRASLSLLLQMLVATALVVAIAGPGLIGSKPSPRKIALVVDCSAYMSPRADDMQRELSKLDPTDDITLIESPSLERRRWPGGFKIRPDRVGDPGPALDLASAEAKQIVFVGDRAPSWSPPPGVTLHLALVGGPLRNAGIVDAGVDNGKLFLRLSSPAEVSVTVDGTSRRLPPASFHLMDLPSGASRIEAAVDADEFTADDRVELVRSEGRIDVGFEGRPDPAILAAIEANALARVVRGGSPRLLIRVGSAVPREAPVVVDMDPPEGVESRMPPGSLSLSSHPLMEGVKVGDLRFLEVGKLAAPVETPLIFNDGAPVAALRRPGEIVLAVRYETAGWPASRAFPIFWANVLKYSASGIGEWRAKGLLSEVASSPGRDRKPFDPGALEARPLAPARTDLTTGAVALAAALLALLWRLENRQTS